MDKNEIAKTLWSNGLTGRDIMDGTDYLLFSFSNTWCSAHLKFDEFTGEWTLRAKYVANSQRRFKNVYKGPRLETAIKKAVELIDDEKEVPGLSWGACYNDEMGNSRATELFPRKKEADQAAKSARAGHEKGVRVFCVWQTPEEG